MAVVLPPEVSAEPRPSAPRPIVWLVLLMITMTLGVVVALITWPTGEPTTTAWFWIRLLVIPFLIWGGVFGLRTLYYEQENERIDAENDVLREDRQQAITFASEPLAVVSYAYLTGAGHRDVATIVAREVAGQASEDRGGGQFAALALTGSDDDSTHYPACFEELIEALSTSVQTIPHEVPFGVCLQLPDDADRDALLTTWQAYWNASGLRAATAVLLASDQGVMALDQWLDFYGGPQLEKIMLYVAVSLNEQGGAEAAVGLLLGWAPQVSRRQLPIVALLHRPVDVGAQTVAEGLATALRWGRAEDNQINDLWQAGLLPSDKTAILRGLVNCSKGHDIDAVLGHAGHAAAWLALAFGIESAAQKKTPQLVAWRDGTLRFATIQPAVSA